MARPSRHDYDALHLVEARRAREIYREFYENRAVWQKLARKNAAKSVSCRTIPYKMKQGINSRRTGNLLSRAGNLQRLAGNCPPCAGISPELSRFPHSVVETLTLVISRRHTSSSRMIDNSFRCSFPTAEERRSITRTFSTAKSRTSVETRTWIQQASGLAAHRRTV